MHLLLIDGSSYIFRAYHALPPLTRKSDGLPVGAVSGFCNMLWKVLQSAHVQHTFTHIAVIFDAKGDTFRNEMYDKYKANRSAPPEDLIPQFALIRQAVAAFGVPSVELAGFEADDLMATYAREVEKLGGITTLYTSDKDMMQLIRPSVIMYDPMKDKPITEVEVLEKFGVTPAQVVHVQALMGDSTDNIPGIPGVGPKTAGQLIAEFGSVEGVITAAPQMPASKKRENILANIDNARISYQLALLKDDCPMPTPIDELVVNGTDAKTLIGFLKALDFTTLTRRVAAEYEADLTAIDAAQVDVGGWENAQPSAPVILNAAQRSEGSPASRGSTQGDSSATPQNDTAGLTSPQTFSQSRISAAASAPITREGYETITTLAQLQRWVEAITAAGVCAFDTETNALSSSQADLVGISLCYAQGKACYIPLQHRSGGDLFADSGAMADQIPLKDTIAALKPILESANILKIGQNIKYDMLLMARYGVNIYPHDDTMLISYALDSGRGIGMGMDALSKHWLGHEPLKFKDVLAKTKAANFEAVPIADATQYAAEDADVTLRLWQVFKPRLAAEGMTTVYETLERPLIPALVAMEGAGIKVNKPFLAQLSHEFGTQMAALELEIHALAGQSFNIASPKQMGDILFGTLGLKGGKKTATGAWATGADVLEELAADGSELPRRILDWRQLQKLKSTYTDALQAAINPKTGRVHTSYSLAATTTGRLSSNEPNLQNIPIRTPEGRKIREAFIAEPGNVLIAADYSQIELRILAHVAGIPALQQAFAQGLDIHAMTASKVFGVQLTGMDPMIRRKAKAINFGIIYGISAFGLANQLGCGRSEAQELITAYFAQFPGIKAYMDSTKEACKLYGYVRTIFGRTIHIPQIHSKNGAERSFAERQAINAPIQGAAADIIRRAMVRIHGALRGTSTKMLLQVHDELVFECPAESAASVMPMIQKLMIEAAHPAVQLSVPLEVDIRQGATWGQAH